MAGVSMKLAAQLRFLSRLVLAGGVAALSMFATSALAQGTSAYPTRPVKLVVVFPPGGTSDILARQLAAEMAKPLGQPVIVDNRPGAAGNIGSAYAAKSPGDGYTLLLGSVGPHAINPSIYKELPYDVLKDLQPVSMVAALTPVLVASPKLEARTVQSLVALAKARPGEVAYASAGTGSSQHLAGAWFEELAGIKMLHVPYKGEGPAIVDLIGGRVQVLFSLVAGSLGHIKSGAIRPLAVAGAKRSPLLPNVPTFREAGYPEFEYSSWLCVFAPANTPKPIVGALNKAVVAAVKSPKLSGAITDAGAESITSSPEELHDFVKSEIAKWGRLVDRSGIVPE